MLLVEIKLYFNLDEHRDNVVLNKQTTENGSTYNQYFRLTYLQFYTFLKIVHEKETVALEQRRQREEEERQARLRSETAQSKEIFQILYQNLGLSKHLRAVVAIEDLRNDDTTPNTFNVFLQPNILTGYAMKHIENGTIPNSNYKDIMNFNFDFSSIYVYKLSMNTSNRIDSVSITRKPLRSEDGLVEDCVFLSQIVTNALQNKSLDYLVDNYYLLESIPKTLFDNNQILRERILEIKDKPQQMNWEGLSV